MHINSHFGIGIIFASILNYFYAFNLFEFSLIVVSSFICDFDVFLSKFAKDHNHRMLITHSIIPSVIIIIIGLILNWLVLTLIGITYFIHIVIDTFDWGTNFFYIQKKQVGIKFMFTKDEFENLSHYLSQYKNPASFFDSKYYNNKICLTIEISIFILMVLSVIIFAFQYVLIILLYIPFFGLHLSRHFQLKKLEVN